MNVVFCALAAVRMKDSALCRFHHRQGLMLFALWLFTLLIALLSAKLALMLWGAVLLLHGSGMVMAWQGKMIKIPLLGQLAMMIPENYFFLFLTGKTAQKMDNTPGNNLTK
ncbi:hypothetical protein JKY72_01020 [Candidatus Gracilibacteria bacterium]|nr:hypothetical protein [Candidatus Gracilibacteria bacterium]